MIKLKVTSQGLSYWKGEEEKTPECVDRSGRSLLEKKGFHRSWKTGRDSSDLFISELKLGT